MRLSGNATLAQLPSPAGPIGRRATAVFQIVRLVLMVSAWTAIPLHWGFVMKTNPFLMLFSLSVMGCSSAGHQPIAGSPPSPAMLRIHTAEYRLLEGDELRAALVGRMMRRQLIDRNEIASSAVDPPCEQFHADGSTYVRCGGIRPRQTGTYTLHDDHFCVTSALGNHCRALYRSAGTSNVAVRWLDSGASYSAHVQQLPEGWSPNGADERLLTFIETRLTLPIDAGPLEHYARYYYRLPPTEASRYLSGTANSDTAQDPRILGKFTYALPGREWVRDKEGLPHVYDGGCGVITMVFNLRLGSVEFVSCNGHA